MIESPGSLFENRRDAGKKLGEFLKRRNITDAVILALPRGGVVVADQVATALHLPMDVVIARKIGAPDQPEFGIGALSEDGIPFFNPTVSHFYHPKAAMVKNIIKEEAMELRRRVDLYRGGHKLPEMKDKTVIVIDDGLATGVTAIAAGKFLRTLKPKKLTLAVPVGPYEVSPEIRETFDEIICLHSLQNLRGIGLWYQDFDQTEDEEVISILKKYH